MEAGEKKATHYIRAQVSEMGSTEIHADPEIVEAIALRVVELLGGAAPEAPVRLVDAGRVARDSASSAIGSTTTPTSSARSASAARAVVCASTSSWSKSGSAARSRPRGGRRDGPRAREESA
jgi:hypothetical protein